MVRYGAGLFIVVSALAASACGGVTTSGHGDPDGTNGGGSGGAGGGGFSGSSAGGAGGSILPGAGGGSTGGGGVCNFGSPEVCDGVDNDCDGLGDEPETTPGAGDGIDFTAVEHCGTCNVDCTSPFGGPQEAFGPKCIPPSFESLGKVDGKCDYTSCAVGYVDLDGDRSNGCEYACPFTPLGHVADLGGSYCGVDDDCNGLVDDYSFCDSDCGGCGITCLDRPHLGGLCVSVPGPVEPCQPGTSACTYGPCDPGWEDRNDDQLDGCEARTDSPSQSGPEICNGYDDDGDGLIDEAGPPPDGIDGTADANYPTNVLGTICGSSVGICKQGVFQCHGGDVLCMGAIGPTPELCNGLDDDCDGDVDETPDTQCGTGFCANVSGYAECIEGCSTTACPVGTTCVQEVRVSTRSDVVHTAPGCLAIHDPR